MDNSSNWHRWRQKGDVENWGSYPWLGVLCPQRWNPSLNQAERLLWWTFNNLHRTEDTPPQQAQKGKQAGVRQTLWRVSMGHQSKWRASMLTMGDKWPTACWTRYCANWIYKKQELTDEVKEPKDIFKMKKISPTKNHNDPTWRQLPFLK